MATVACPACRNALEIPAEMADRQVRCKICGQVFVPSAAGNPAFSPAAAGFSAGMPGQPYEQPKKNGSAIAALVLGIVSIPTCMCYGVPSLVCGILALVFASIATKQINDGIGQPSSAGMIKAGKICGIIGLVLTVLCWILLGIYIAIIVVAVQHGQHPPQFGPRFP